MYSHLVDLKKEMKILGNALIKSVLTGMVCPCVDSETGHPSREWHRLNPLAEDCGGTGLISSTRTDTSFYAFVQEPDGEELEKQPPGLRDKNILIYYGGVDDNLNFVSLIDMDDKRDYVIFNGDKYIVHDVKEHYYGSDKLYEKATLLRREN